MDNFDKSFKHMFDVYSMRDCMQVKEYWDYLNKENKILIHITQSKSKNQITRSVLCKFKYNWTKQKS